MELPLTDISDLEREHLVVTYSPEKRLIYTKLITSVEKLEASQKRKDKHK